MSKNNSVDPAGEVPRFPPGQSRKPGDLDDQPGQGVGPERRGRNKPSGDADHRPTRQDEHRGKGPRRGDV